MTEPVASPALHPDLSRMRAYRPDDMPLLLRLLTEANAWPPSGSPTADQVLSRWARRGVHPVEHVHVLEDEYAGLMAYWNATPFADATGRMGFDIAIDPRFRRQGLGTALLDLVREQAHHFGSGRLTCPVFVSEANNTPAGSLFLLKYGFRTDHGYWQLRINNIEMHSRPAWPDGIQVRGVANLEDDVETWCKLVLLAFGEETTPVGVLAQMHEPGGSPDGYFFAVDQATGLEVGTSRARIDTNDAGRIGYIGTVGVLPEYRRRGIAEALVRHTLSYLAGLGLDSATLFVERQNLAARRIYDVMGWHPVYRTDHYWQATASFGRSSKTNDG